MKPFTLLLLVLVCLAVACSVQVEKNVLEGEPAEPISPVVEMPAEVGEEPGILVQPGNGNGLEPVMIEIVAARQITPYNPTVIVGQEIVFVNKHVDGKEDREYIIRGDKFANFESPLLQPGDTWSYTFTKPGDYQYVLMPGAAGRVSVVGNVVKKLFT
ncbi:hypothetical protein KY328_04275 [Candidatus Woesearchaeota archaeon]|nr:hypothetical protein [Candidatus Woesearchaeota archaeon]